jgi:hypothetical protein
MKPESPLDIPADQQHTPRYFYLQGSSPGFSPLVSNGTLDDPALADRRGSHEWKDKIMQGAGAHD